MFIKLQLDQLVHSVSLQQWLFDNHMNCVILTVQVLGVEFLIFERIHSFSYFLSEMSG